MDESGDLGFSRGSSTHFLVICLATSEPNRLARIVRRSHQKYASSCRGNPELKFNRCPDAVRRYVLDGLSKTDSQIVWKGVRKPEVRRSLREAKDELWGIVAASALREVSMRIQARSMRIVVDRRSLKKKGRDALDQVLLSTVAASHSSLLPPTVRISHVNSISCEPLQVADHVAGAVFQSLERGRLAYLRAIGPRIVDGCVIRI